MANVSKIQLPNGDIYALEDSAAQSALSSKQDKLVSGTNIKTVNSNSLVGSGNVSVGTITGVTAGSGLSDGGTSGSVTLNHSNSVTAGTASATTGRHEKWFRNKPFRFACEHVPWAESPCVTCVHESMLECVVKPQHHLTKRNVHPNYSPLCSMRPNPKC